MAQPSISAATRLACVIGDPIRHSLSPTLHNAAFRHLGIDAVYVALQIRPADLRTGIAGLRSIGVMGFNVTVPHKERIVPLLDSVSAAAKATGAVNTVVNRNGKLHGENTDVIGFARALGEARVELQGARVLLMGAGGASRAVMAALAQGGARSVTIANRTPRRATTLAKQFCTRQFECSNARIDRLTATELESIDLVINATSVGLLGESYFELPFEAFKKSCVFYDLIPRVQTDFLTQAKRTRHRALDGLGMLLHQGAAAFEIWTGQTAPLTIMRTALRRAIRIH